MTEEIPGADLHLARLTNEFAHFQAILGWRIRDTSQWAPFARLRDLYGWRKLTRACEQCDPGARWASDMEKLCRQYAKDDAEAKAFAEKPEPITTPLTQSQRASRSALFQLTRKRFGV